MFSERPSKVTTVGDGAIAGKATSLSQNTRLIIKSFQSVTGA